MSHKDLPNKQGSGGHSPTLQAMQKPSAPVPQSKPVSPTVPQQKNAETGSPTLTNVLIGAVGLALIGGLVYIGYELTKPTKKSQPGKKPLLADKENNTTTKQESKVNVPLLKVDKEESEKHEVLLERKPNEDVGIFLCPGEDNQPGAFVAANSANEKLGLEIGAQLVEINGRVLNSAMSYNDVAKLLTKSCSPTGKLCFKKNPTLGDRWKEAETTKNSGNVLYKNKEFDEAIKKYTTAIDIHPTNIFYYSNKVFAMYSKAQKNPAKAAEIYAEALGLCQKIKDLDVLQNFKKGYHLRGVILCELSRYEEAKKEFEKYLQIDSTNEKIRGRLQACEKAIAADVAAKATEGTQSEQKSSDVKKDDEVIVNLSYTDDIKAPTKQTESPSPVLVEKPTPTEVAEVERLGGNEQQDQKTKQEQGETGKKVVDDCPGAKNVPSEEVKNKTMSLDKGGNGSVEVQ